MDTQTIVRCGISYDRQPYEPVRPYENVADISATSAGIALVHGILTHFCGHGFYDVDEMLLPISPSMVNPVIIQLKKHFKPRDGRFTFPIGIQAQTDSPRTCVSCNVVGFLDPCQVYPSPTILTTSEDTNIMLIQGGEILTYLFPKIGDSIISVMSEEDQSEIAPGGSWDDMNYDMLPPMSNGFFQMFMKYLVAIICYGDKKYQARHLSNDFPKEYLHPVFTEGN